MRAAPDAPPGVPHLRSAHSRCERVGASGVVQLVVPAGPAPRPRSSRAATGRSSGARTAACSSPTPSSSSSSAEEADTMHTGRIVPIYERAGSITPKMQRRLVARGAAAAAGRRSTIRCRPSFGRASRLPAAAARRSSRRTSRRAARPSTRSTPIATPAQRRLIFEEFFLLPGRACCCGSASRKPSAKRCVTRVDDRIRDALRARAAVQASPPASGTRSRRSSTTCSGRSR